MNKLLVFFTAYLIIGGQLFSQITHKPEMVLIEGGTYSMGYSCALPIHTVTVSSFNMGKYEVTVAEYKAFCTAVGRIMPDAPSWGWNDKHPMVNVNFDDANAYCNWLSDSTGNKYRLPTEAEWEFAARGGNKSQSYIYSGSDNLFDVGWFDRNSYQTENVGSKSANELGLYDLSGNVWEICGDWYSKKYTADAQINPEGPSSGKMRVMRGGSWRLANASCKVAFHYGTGLNSKTNSKGFRVVFSD